MKRVLKYLFLLLLLVLVFGGIYILLINLKVQHIICESQYGSCGTNLKFQISNLKHNNIFETRRELNNLLKKNTGVLDYSIEFKFPLDLTVHVIERQPVIAFLLANGKYALVDRNGVITDEATGTNLPKIVTIPLNQDELEFSSNIIWRLYNYFKPKGNIKITADGIEVDNIAGKKVIFPLIGDADLLLGSLNLIISRLPSVKEATTMGIIDLRFKNPVLR